VQIGSLAEEPSWWQYERLRRVPPISPRRRQDRPRLVRRKFPPQSLLAMTFSPPTNFALLLMRLAISSGCSMKLDLDSMTPGIKILLPGNFTVSNKSHS
jgi:hypothetical protein